jgi:hypothetical protein
VQRQNGAGPASDRPESEPLDSKCANTPSNAAPRQARQRTSPRNFGAAFHHNVRRPPNFRNDLIEAADFDADCWISLPGAAARWLQQIADLSEGAE